MEVNLNLANILHQIPFIITMISF